VEELFLALLPWLVLFGLWYLLLIRPQQVRNRKREEMLNSLKKGDRIVTIGGIHGTITSLQGDVVQVRIADRVEIKLNRNGIAHRVEARD